MLVLQMFQLQPKVSPKTPPMMLSTEKPRKESLPGLFRPIPQIRLSSGFWKVTLYPQKKEFSFLFEPMYSSVFLTQLLGGWGWGKRCFILLNALGLMHLFYFISVTTFCFGELLSQHHEQCLSAKQESLHSISVGSKGKERKTACFHGP